MIKRGMEVDDFVVMLRRGERLHEAVEGVFADSPYDEILITGAIGSVSEVTISYPEGDSFPPVVKRKRLQGAMEVVSLVGNVWREEDGATKVHIHGAFAVSGGVVYGGGVNPVCEVYSSLEVFMKGVKFL